MKNQVNQLLRNILENHDSTLSAWLGGSTATKREDDLSDTDIVLISIDSDQTFDVIEKAFNEHFGIEDTWVVEGPSKYHQRFYTLKGTPNTYYVDVVIFDQLTPSHFSEYFNVDRHGTPVILFDKKQILAEAAKTPTRENPVINLTNVKSKFEIMYRTMLKEYLRGKFIDTYTFYIRLIAIYVQVLRIKHSPQKHDFHLRYLYVDLPAEEAKFIEKLLQVKTLEDMKSNSELIKAKILKISGP